MTSPSQRHFLSLAVLFVCSGLFSAALFLIGDYHYTNTLTRKRAKLISRHCVAPDSSLHHAFLPNCTALGAWGENLYPIFTNNLGLRDVNIREVPLRVEPPRILFEGDSFTESKLPWEDSFVGQFARAAPQYDVLNGGCESYAPSTYYLLARTLLEKGVVLDEVIVFIDISDIQDEAAFYVDTSATAVAARSTMHQPTPYEWARRWLQQHLMLTNRLYLLGERALTCLGLYLPRYSGGDIFDMPRSAWTYRQGLDNRPFVDGYAPLGVKGGILKSEAKMDLLYQLLRLKGISLSVAVYPWPAQLAHNDRNSEQVQIWEKWCQGKCSRFINLFPDMFAEKERSSKIFSGAWYEKLFIFGDVHFNAYGNAVITRRLVSEFEKKPLLKAAHR